jgi:pyrimidine-nucleoside phosphorylase
MRMIDIIVKKQRNESLTEGEIAFFVKSVTDGSIPDYQISAFLMAVYFNGMEAQETALLTKYMASSGDMVDLSPIAGVKVDKHSTGGVGDKTTLVVAPIVASCGVRVAKMSGRGLGHTGGTLDKLESIPGFKVNLPREEFFRIVNQVGVCVIGQTGNICPADKKLYALRDVTATVQSMPLIASSVMSKKLAAGADCILLDVKAGSGAFMKTKEDAMALAREMVAIGEANGKKTAALVTNMDVPLGRNIGNALEIVEVVETLNGKGPEDLTRLCLELAANMLLLGGSGDYAACRKLAEDSLGSGRALESFKKMAGAQGGDVSYIEHPEKFPKAAHIAEVIAAQGGFIAHMDAEKCGVASGLLGAGRETKESTIDYAAGIVLKKKTGDAVRAGDVIAQMHSSDTGKVAAASEVFLSGIAYSDGKPAQTPLILDRVGIE